MPEVTEVINLLFGLDKKLINLLESLTAEQWEKQTVASQWKVKDVAAHLLDGNIRILSVLRDNYHASSPESTTYEGLVHYLNQMNAEWVTAMKRVSPEMLILLHKVTGPLYCDYYKSLDPKGISPFPVSWAGEEESENQMHIAREYTEKWLHQQQIREAIGNSELMAREYFYPFTDIFMMGLPHAYRSVSAEEGTIIKVTVLSETGGSWLLIRSNKKWVLNKNESLSADTELRIEPDIAWKLFSKSIRAESVNDKILIKGNIQLAEPALNMVSVMA